MFHIVTYKIMIKKRNKQQSLAGRIDKLGGPEFENHCSIPSKYIALLVKYS